MKPGLSHGLSVGLCPDKPRLGRNDQRMRDLRMALILIFPLLIGAGDAYGRGADRGGHGGGGFGGGWHGGSPRDGGGYGGVIVGAPVPGDAYPPIPYPYPGPYPYPPRFHHLPTRHTLRLIRDQPPILRMMPLLRRKLYRFHRRGTSASRRKASIRMSRVARPRGDRRLSYRLRAMLSLPSRFCHGNIAATPSAIILM